MDVTLSPVEVRIIGCLVEKQVATPEHYPLTLNALQLACNQTTNREPVTSYDSGTIELALEGLRQKGLVWVVRGGRATKYEQRFGEKFKLGPRETATMCVLMLRGAQTAGEIRARTGRLFEFSNLEEVEASLDSLMRENPPLAAKLPRLPGTKEHRFAHLLAGDVASAAYDAAPGEPATTGAQVESGKVAMLEQEIAALRQELNQLREEFQALMRRLE